MQPQFKEFLLFLLGGVATLAGAIATWMLVGVYIRSSRPGAETFGFEFVFMPLFLLAALGCFGLAWLCFFNPDKIAPQFSLRSLLVLVTLIAVVLGFVCYTVR